MFLERRKVNKLKYLGQVTDILLEFNNFLIFNVYHLIQIKIKIL